MPAYAPELNPDELLNQDTKANAMKKGRPENKEQLKKILRSYLKKTQKTPQKIMHFFLKKEVRYIAEAKL